MEYIKYRSGYKHQLAEEYHTQVSIYPKKAVELEYLVLTIKGELIVRSGYAWDGASGPARDTSTVMRGSLVHDALYQIFRLGLLDPDLYRRQADKELRRICREDGMSRFRAWYVFRAVRRMAGKAADPRNQKKIKTAPRRKRNQDEERS